MFVFFRCIRNWKYCRFYSPLYKRCFSEDTEGRSTHLRHASWMAAIPKGGNLLSNLSTSPGADPGFSFRGRGRKRLCYRTHITSAEPTRGTETHFRQGSRTRLRGPGSSRVVLMLSRAIWALFLSILVKLDFKKIVWTKFRGGARLLRPLPPPPPLGSTTASLTYHPGDDSHVLIRMSRSSNPRT